MPYPTRFLRLVRQLCRSAGRDFRTYQAYAARDTLRQLARSSVLLNLPQGTGKTFVSQLVAFAFLRRQPKAKILVVVPTKELREQYVDMAGWMGHLEPRTVVFEFAEPIIDVRKQLVSMVQRANIIVTTPKVFTNRIDSLPDESKKAISLCVLDEIDLWSIKDYEEDVGVRYEAAFRELRSCFEGQQIRFVGLTASSLEEGPRVLLVEDLGCHELFPFHSSIVKWLPKVKVEPVACIDPVVEAQDVLISEQSKRLLRQLATEILPDSFDAHQRDFWLYIKVLANGREGPIARKLALALLENERERLQLFEDSLSGEAKIKCATRLAKSRRPAVIYCREIRLVERFEQSRWPTPPAIAHSGLGDRYLTEMKKFTSGMRDFLLMTRDLGKRGLDFPMAQSLIIISPKNSWRTMDQELCRTRGKRGKSKCVHVLFYKNTHEEEKMRRVLSQLMKVRMYSTFHKFTLSRFWYKWLQDRPAKPLSKYLAAQGDKRMTLRHPVR